MFVGLCVAFMWLIPIELLTLTLRRYIPMIFTSEPTILQAINVHIYIMTVSIFCDALVNTLSGVIVGSGLQIVGAGLNILCFWIVGIPVATSLALAAHLGALGYMIGEACAVFCMLCIYSIATAAINWKKQSEKAQKMAVIHPVEEKQEGGSSSGKETEPPKEMSDIPKEEGNEGSKTIDPEHDTSKKTESGSMEDSLSGGSSELKDTSSEADQKKFPVRWWTVVLRIVIVATFIILCVGTIVISQELVYHQAPCSTTLAGNLSEYLPPASKLHSEMLQSVSAADLHCTSPTGVVPTMNYLPAPTPIPQ